MTNEFIHINDDFNIKFIKLSSIKYTNDRANEFLKKRWN